MEIEIIYMKNKKNNGWIEAEEVEREIQDVGSLEDISLDQDIEWDFVDIFNAESKEYIKSIIREEVI